MDYPKYPKSKPLSGKQAERVRKAIRSGGSITNAASERLFREIIERRKKLKTNGEATDTLQ